MAYETLSKKGISHLETKKHVYENEDFIIWITKNWFNKGVHDFSIINQTDKNCDLWGKITTKQLLRLVDDYGFFYMGVIN